MMISVIDIVENIAGKGENEDYQYFLLFPQCFQKLSVSGSGLFSVTKKGITLSKIIL